MLFSYDTEILPEVRMIGQIKYPGQWVHFSRVIDEYIMYLIKEGDMYIEEKGIQYHLKPGDLFILEPNKPHFGYKAASCNYYYVHFQNISFIPLADDKERFAMNELADKRITSLASYNLDSGNVTDSITYIPKLFSIQNQEFRTILKESIDIYNHREEHYKRASSTLLHLFLLQVAHANLIQHNANQISTHIKKSAVVVEKILKYLNNNYYEKVSSSLIEKTFEVNFDYINRVFSDITGNTIFHYLNILRINHAKELIATTNLTFSEIGYLVGIDDRYYFTKQFKKYVGMTPTEYYKSVNTSNKKEE